MDVTLPNGVVIEGVPEGTSKEDIMQKRFLEGLLLSRTLAPLWICQRHRSQLRNHPS